MDAGDSSCAYLVGVGLWSGNESGYDVATGLDASARIEKCWHPAESEYADSRRRLHFVTIKRMSTEQEKLKAEHENLNDKLNQVCEEARALLRMEWLQSLHDINYGSELEVEIKFLTQLLMHLGYDIKNVSIRIPVNIKAGRQVISAQADWLINISTIVARKKFMVIEAKAPDQDLNSDVGEQARSYAFALNAPLYMLTNARRIMIFKLGVPQDFLLIDVPVSELTESWSTLTALLKQLGD